MKNNNDDNLFSQMFGLDSEEPKINPITEPKTSSIPTPEISTTPTVEVSSESSQVISQSEIQIEENPLDSLNMGIKSKKVEESVSNPNEIMVLAPAEKTEPPTEVLDKNIEIPEKFQPNLISSTPSEYKPSNINFDDYGESLENASANSVVIKVVGLLIIVLLVIGGWIVFYNKDLSDNNNENNKIEQPDEVEKEESPEDKQEEPVTVTIEFDESFSFYHSLTTNELELYKTEPFTPEKTTGIIRCETINPILIGNILTYEHLYFYYEDQLLRKIMTNQIAMYPDQSLYQTAIYESTLLQQAWSNKEGIRFSYERFDNEKALHNIVWYNLAYGSYFTTGEGSKLYYRLKYDYKENIRKSIGTTLGEYPGNMHCSSVITPEEYLADNTI